MNTPIRYSIRPSNPNAHRFEVQCRIPQPDPSGQIVTLPNWIPGSYMIRDFSRHITRLQAWSGNAGIAITKLDKARWQCAPVNGPLTLKYSIYAWDLSVRGAHLDQTHGFFNGTSVLLRIEGQQHQPCEIDIQPPEDPALSRWQVATTLTRGSADGTDAGAPDWGFGLHHAANYDELIDHPVEMGRFTLASFRACGVPHHIAITGRHRADMARLCRDLTRICEHHIRLFGEPAPIDRYLFQVMAVGDGYGGLEHRNSTALICKRDDLPLEGEDSISDGYRQFLGLCSHEYFHAWNVKRIKPACFSPYQLDRETYTRQLWAFEGITSYYDDLSLSRCGLISADSYLELLGQTITRVLRGSGRHHQSVADSSFDAWTKFYRQDENASNAIVSYYTKGSLIALALDLMIRETSDGQRSLDDLMRLLWQRYGQDPDGVPEGAIEQHAAELVGQPLDDFFANTLYGCEDPPLRDLLQRIGIDLELRPGTGQQDRGGKPAPDATPAAPSLGLRLAATGSDAKVAAVFDDGPAQRAGIAASDILIALDGLRITRGNLEKQLKRYPTGATLAVHAFRRDELMAFQLQLQAAPTDTCYLRQQDVPDAATVQRRNRWLTPDT